MYLQAISLGYAVPTGHFNANIRSVFRSAVNLKLSGDWELLTVVASSEADLPHGIRVDTPEGFTFEDLKVGEAVICSDGIVRFQNTSIEVDLRKAHRWDCDLSSCNFDGTNPSVVRAWQLVWRSLNGRQLAYGAEMVGALLLHPRDGEDSVTLHRLANASPARRHWLALQRINSSLEHRNMSQPASSSWVAGSTAASRNPEPSTVKD